MRKKVLCVLVVALIVLSLAGCNEKKILGSWELLNENDQECGVVITFFEDGTYKYGTDWSVNVNSKAYTMLMDSEMLGSIMAYADISNTGELEDILNQINEVVVLKYDIKSPTKMVLKIELLLGLLNKTTTIKYSIAGDTLTFDGNKYKRVEEFE